MLSTFVVSTLLVALVALVVAYLWPRPDVRFEKLFVATFGALVGSLIGRAAADPGWLGHLLFVASGAFAFSFIDWMVRTSRRAQER